MLHFNASILIAHLLPLHNALVSSEVLAVFKTFDTVIFDIPSSVAILHGNLFKQFTSALAELPPNTSACLINCMKRILNSEILYFTIRNPNVKYRFVFQ